MADGETTSTHLWGVATCTLVIDLPAGLDPLRDVIGSVRFTAPSGRDHVTPIFWDGGQTWRARVTLTELGTWGALATATDTTGAPFATTVPDDQFTCVPYVGTHAIYVHGHVRHASGAGYLWHADGTPFVWLGDTAWNGPLVSDDDDWETYLATRETQGFTVSQFVTTQWCGLPDGGPEGPAFTHDGEHLLGINPEVMQRLDRRLNSLGAHGIVGAPVLIWAHETKVLDPGDRVIIEDTTGIDVDNLPEQEIIEHNPGAYLDDESLIVLARHMHARWHAHPVVLILSGDGDYLAEKADRWRRIGRAVFGEAPTPDRAPIAIHPMGRHWVGAEFADEAWVDIIGYQSGHGGGILSWRWLQDGPLPTGSAQNAHQAVINLEICYEDHNRMYVMVGVPPGWVGRFSERDVRRAIYPSFLVTAPAGATYGAHGVWSWEPGGKRPKGHYTTGEAKPWQTALDLPGAHAIAHVRTHLASIAWWRLRPAPWLVTAQPGDNGQFTRWVTAAHDPIGQVTVAYFASSHAVTLDLAPLQAPHAILRGTWRNPRDGTSREPFVIDSGHLVPPDGWGSDEPLTPGISYPDDWLLVIMREASLEG